MSNFALNVNSSPQAIIQSLNYALATAATATSTSINGNVLQSNVTTGAVTTNGNVVSYLYPYMNVAYANSASGSGFTSNCSYATYYGVHNTTANIADTNPADYQWYQVAGGFGNTKYLYYDVVGGRTINFNIGTTSPGYYYRQVQDNVAINLDTVTSTQTIYTTQIYQANATVPTTPTGGSYNFSTVTLTPPVGWSSNIPFKPAGTQVYSSQNTFVSSQNFSNPPVTTWTTPQVVTASNGASGISTYTFPVYTVANTQPSTPLTNTGSWNFGTNSGTPPLAPNWYQSGSTVSLRADGTQSNALAIYSNTVGYYTYQTVFQNNLLQNTNTNGYYVGNGPDGTQGWNIDSSGSNGYSNLGYIDVGSGPGAYVDILLIGGGGAGSVNSELVYGTGYYTQYFPGGSGGYVKTYSNVYLSPSTTYEFIVGTGSASKILGLSGVDYAASGQSGYTNATNYGIVGGYGGGNVNPPSGTFIPGSYTPINGGAGIVSPFQDASWVGQNSGGTLYVAGGGATGLDYSGPGAGNGTGGVGGGGNGNQIGSYAGGTGGGAHHVVGLATEGYATTGYIVIRQSANVVPQWTTIQPTPTVGNVVYISTAVANTGNVPTANVTTLTWSTPAQLSGNIGYTGQRGIFSSAYVVTASDPTFYSTTQYNTAFSANRANVAPPIGTGYSPLNGDTATFTYVPTNTVVTKTYNSAVNTWLSANTQYISGNLFVSNSISSTSLITTNLYPLNIVSQNATFGNTSSAGYWLQASTGSASFAGSMNIGNNLTVGSNASIGSNLNIGTNLTVGSNASIGSNLTVGTNLTVANNAKIGANLTVGNNAVIGSNLFVQGLITGGSLAANVVNSTNIAPNAVTSSAIAPLAVGAAAIASSSLLSRMFSPNSVPASALTPGASTQVLTVTSSDDYAVTDPTEDTFYSFGPEITANVAVGDTIYVSAVATGFLTFASAVPDVSEWGITFRLTGTNPDTTTNASFDQIAYWMNWAPYNDSVQTNYQSVIYSFTATQAGTMTFTTEYSWNQTSSFSDTPTELKIDGTSSMTAILAPYVG